MATTEIQTAPSASAEFWQGFWAGIPVVIASSPFGVLFGVLAVQQGMTVTEAMMMSALLFTGASQMVGIELFGKAIPAWLVVFSIFAVNFRHILYSASVGRRIGHWATWQKTLGFYVLTDPQYAAVEQRGEAGISTSFAWYIGMAAPLYVFWVAESGLGAAFGNLLPDTHALGFDYLLPIYFMGLVMGFRKRPRWLPIVLASAAASILAYIYVGSPWHVSIGAAAGILLAAIMAPGNSEPLHDPEPDETGVAP